MPERETAGQAPEARRPARQRGPRTAHLHHWHPCRLRLRAAAAVRREPAVGVAGGAAADRHRGLSLQHLDRRGHGRLLDRRGAGDPRHHHHQVPAIPLRALDHSGPETLAAALHHSRPPLRPRLDVQPHPSGRPGRGLQHLHAVRDAARGGGVEHAGVEPADRRVRGDHAGDLRGCAQLRAARRSAQLHSRDHGDRRARLFHTAGASVVFGGPGDAGGARREGCADRRAGTGEIDFRRRAAARGRLPTSPSRNSSPR